jgi:acyl-CoA dehydrogenase
VARLLDRKPAHAKASFAKLHANEMVGRVIDQALQVPGGRGYKRENPVERLYRDVRVDRVWEVQRVLICGQTRKRGLSTYTGWIGEHLR